LPWVNNEDIIITIDEKHLILRIEGFTAVKIYVKGAVIYGGFRAD